MGDLAVCALFVRIRWKMLRGVLTTSGSQKVAVVIGLVASVIAGVVGGVAAFVIGRTSDDLDAAYVTLITGIVLIVVMVGVIAGVTQPVDPRVLATEPLGQRQLGLGLLAASASGPPGLSAVLVAVGLFAARFEGWLSIIPVTFAVVAFLATLAAACRARRSTRSVCSRRATPVSARSSSDCRAWRSMRRSRSFPVPSPTSTTTSELGWPTGWRSPRWGRSAVGSPMRAPSLRSRSSTWWSVPSGSFRCCGCSRGRPAVSSRR